jgi:hypothetical protein
MEIVEFQCWRCIDGYELFIPSRERVRFGMKRRRLTPLIPAAKPSNPKASGIRSKSEKFEQYDPLKISGGLFRTLADTPGTPTGMLAFSNKFGLLTMTFAGKPKSVKMGVDELLWERALLCHAVELFEQGKQTELVRYFNQSCDKRGWGRARHELRLEPDGRIVRVLVPDNLIHALWLQFATHIESDAKLVRCLQCGEWFRVGTATKRRETAKYCSSRCRQAAYVARKEA